MIPKVGKKLKSLWANITEEKINQFIKIIVQHSSKIRVFGSHQNFEKEFMQAIMSCMQNNLDISN